MDDEILIEEMVKGLEDSGEITVTGEGLELFIQSIDDKEGYSYVSNTNKEFDDAKDAVDWLVLQFDGAENIEEWE